MAHLTVAAAQFRASDDPDDNLTRIADAAAQAADAGAQVVVFPEAAMARFGSPLRDLAQPLQGPFGDGVRAIADRHTLLLSVGMFTPAGDGRVHNTTLVTGTGVEAHYDKIHLFDALGAAESRTVAPGEGIVTLDALGVRFGVATCYDLRFPEHFLALGRAGAEVILVGASWADGERKAEQFCTLRRARAMDSQCFLVASDQPLTPSLEGHPRGVGHSAIVHPAGHACAELGEDPDVVVATVDTADVAELRRRLPTLGS